MSGDWLKSVDWVRCSRYFYVLVFVTVAALLGSWLSGRAVIETNMLALMPNAERDVVTAQAAAQFDATLARRHVVLVGARDPAQAQAAARKLAEALCDSAAFAEVKLQIDPQQQAAVAALYAPHRSRLLAPAMRERLQQGGAAAAVEHALNTLYSPVAPLSSAMLASDPLLLFYDFVAAQNSARGNVALRDNMLIAERDGWSYVLLQLQLSADPFAVAVQERVVPALDNAAAQVRAQFAGARVLDIGAVRYAAAGVDSARSEVATIGTVSLVGVIAVMLLVFRSPLPLVASLVASAVGYAAALAACWLWFGSIHLLTLVFGSSLLGISIDHCLHFFADRLGTGPGWRADTGLQRIFPGITIGLITTIIGYAGLYLTGFPGMQQMAVFSCVGLTGAYLTVIWFYPVWIKHPAGPARGPWLRYSLVLLHALRPAGRRWPRLLVLPLAVIAVLGLLRVHSNDDIRTLQPVSAQLRAQEQEIRAITGIQPGIQFFLVEGATPAAVLESEEALTVKLREQIGAGALHEYDALTRQLPSPARQRENLALVRALLADTTALTAYAEQMGLDRAVLDEYAVALQQAEAASGLELETWLGSAAGQPWSHLWLGPTARGYAALVPLYGVRDSAALRALAQQQPQWRFVDKTADISALFQRYRERAMLLIALAYGGVYGFLWWRYGYRLALAVMLPTGLAAALTIAGLGWLDQQLNLFHLLALLLVLGIGIDYSLFLLEDTELNAATMLAILLSAVANELSFGLLAVSATPAVRAFGLTVFIGVAGAAILAPLIVDLKNSGWGKRR